jgi:N-acetylglucosaminyldiphosphoundecaprenol N-acetyl-beta-D-mannosaminyltransferase
MELIPQAEVGAVRLDLLDRPDVISRVERALTGQGPAVAVISVNLDHVARFAAGPSLPHGYVDCVEWLALIDGWPIASALAFRTGRSAVRVPGSELLHPIVGLANRHELVVGLLGASDRTRERFGDLGAVFPGVRSWPTWKVDWSDLDRGSVGAELATDIRRTGVDLLIVSLGKPRQEQWLREHMSDTGVRAAVAFGSAVDYLTGARRQAPDILRRLRLEWAYRLASEPARLGRRYLIEAPSAALLLRRAIRLVPPREWGG